MIQLYHENRLGDMPSLLSHKRAGYVCLCRGEFISLKSALHLVLCVAAVVDKSLLFTLYFNNKFRDIYDVFCGKMVLLNWLSFYKHSSLLGGEIGQYLAKLHIQHHFTMNKYMSH